MPKIEYIIKDDEYYWGNIVANRLEITEKQAQAIIEKNVDDNGRSKWYLMRLASGDLVLTCYPRGDTYCDTEAYRGHL